MKFTEILEYEYTRHSPSAIYKGKVLMHFNAREIKYETSWEEGYDFRSMIDTIWNEISRHEDAQIIPVIDMTGSNMIINAVSIEKLLEAIKKRSELHDVIIVGPQAKQVKEFIEKQKEENLYSRGWPTLFYTAFENYFLPIVIYGTTINELCLVNEVCLNTKIYFSGKLVDKPANAEDVLAALYKSDLFYADKCLVKEFDILICNGTQSLFEYFLNECLNTVIDDKKESPDFENENFSTYKIEGHFKIGSKIHITAFYYAKRMFQDSYLVARFCYIIARKLLHPDNREDFMDKMRSGGLTILGYAKYSKMLIYMIASYLEKLEDPLTGKWFNKINTHIISDSDQTVVLDQGEMIHKNILLIIPISSTLSTSVKIMKYLKASPDFEGRYYIPQVVNVLVVADESAKKKIDGLNHRIITDTDVLHQYQWQSIDYERKLIELREVGGNKLISNSYFIMAFTKWYRINECEICFGGDKNRALEELPLIETDKASITPQLIFGEGPVFMEPGRLEPSFKIKDEYYHYGHFKINDVHSVHFINTNLFLNVHRSEIKGWLITMKTEEWLKEIKGDICLVTPEIAYGSDFVYLVNSELFDSSATILHYDPAIPLASNFEALYGTLLKKAEHIIYVGDQVSRGIAFERMQLFLQSYCNGKGFSAFFSMICTSDKDTLELLENANSPTGVKNINTEEKLRINYFFYVRMHNLTTSHIPCPVCKTKTDYLNFAISSSLDSTRHYLYEKARNLNSHSLLQDVKNIFQGYDGTINDNTEYTETDHEQEEYKSFFDHLFIKKKILKLLVEDCLNQHSSLHKDIKRQAGFIDQIAKDTFEKIDAQYSGMFTPEDVRASVIKILSYIPYAQYYPVRRAVFSYLVKKLDEAYGRLDNGKNIDIEFLRHTKLLLRRISELKGNYIIREENFKKLYTFYLTYERTREEDVKQIDNSIDLHISYLVHFLLSIDLKTADILNGPALTEKIKSKKIKYREFDIRDALCETCAKLKNKIHAYININTAKLNDSELKLLNAGDEFTIKKLAYSCRALQNLLYKLILRSDYHYFIAHIVKEITYNSEARAIYLDKMITTQFKEVKSTAPNSFIQLLRIIKMENTGVLTKFLAGRFIPQLLEKYPSGEWNNKMIIEELSSEQNFYEIQPLLEFLDNEEETTWFPEGKPAPEKIKISNSKGNFSISQSFFDFVCLYGFLKGETHNSKLDAPQKLKFIIKSIQKIMNVDDPGSSKALMAIRYTPYANRQVTMQDVIILNEEGEAVKKDSLINPFLLEPLNGLMLRDKGACQNLFVYSKQQNGDWICIKNYYLNRSGIAFTGNYINRHSEADYFKEFSDLLFFRISNLYFQPDEEQINKIVNDGQAILVMASKRDRPYKPEKLRYLLLLKDLLSKFFEKHYTNDSFRSFLQEKEVHDHYTILRHGFGKYVSRAKKLYNDIKENYEEANPVVSQKLERLKKEYELFFSLALDEVNISAIIAENIPNGNENIPAGKILKSDFYPITEFTLTQLKNIIVDLSGTVSYSNALSGIHFATEDFFKNEFRGFEKDSKFFCNENFLRLVVAELLINIKKRNFFNPESQVNVKWTVNEQDKHIILTEENSFEKVNLNANYKIVDSRKGTGIAMVENIFKNFLGTRVNYAIIEKDFSIALQFKTNQDEENSNN